MITNNGLNRTASALTEDEYKVLLGDLLIKIRILEKQNIQLQQQLSLAKSSQTKRDPSPTPSSDNMPQDQGS